jgi:hypothetical protein
MKKHKMHFEPQGEFRKKVEAPAKKNRKGTKKGGKR